MKLRLPLLLALLSGLLLSAPQASHAATLLYYWNGFDYENPDPNPGTFGELGSTYHAVGVVNGLYTPLVPDTTNKQYTFVIDNLQPINRQIVGSFIVVDYAPGIMNVYEDAKLGGTAADYGVFPPNGTAPASFTDGTLFVAGSLTNFQFIFNTATGSGSFSANFNVTGGSQFANFAPNELAGWSFAGSSSNAANIPQGYAHQVVGQNLIDQTTLTRPTTWGRLKASYR